MLAYLLYNNTVTNTEAAIKNNINTFGELAFRRSSLTFMFVNRDPVAAQPITFRYLDAIINSLGLRSILGFLAVWAIIM